MQIAAYSCRSGTDSTLKAHDPSSSLKGHARVATCVLQRATTDSVCRRHLPMRMAPRSHLAKGCHLPVMLRTAIKNLEGLALRIGYAWILCTRASQGATHPLASILL